MMATYLSGAKEAWRIIHQGIPLTSDRKTPQAAIDAAVKAHPNIKIDNEYWDNETLEFVPLSHLHERKANPAPRKRAAKKSTPKSFDQFTKRQLQDFITGCHNARDYGPEFTAACYALNSRPVAARKANPATRKRAISRPSQVTKKAPSKRLVARRKAAAKKPVKGYFPNPKDRELFIVKVTLSDEVMRQTKAPEAARNFVQIYRTQTAAIKNAKANAVLGTVSVTKMCESEMRDAAFMKLIGN